jgi:cobalamin biosynthesis protein CobC
MSDRYKSDLGAGFHGGDLADAVSSAPHEGTSGDWLDLSTGINPHAYPLPELPVQVWRRLPGRDEMNGLLASAAACYGAPGLDHIAAASGSQALIQALPHCLPDLPVTLVGPTYSGHAHGWRAAGRDVGHCTAFTDCDPGGITVLVNPNNPDGRVIPADELGDFADQSTQAGGWLVVDEAFCDLDPSLSLSPKCARTNVVVLRSFGKFFGLAGLRLGFAIAPLALTDQLRRSLGAWAVSGPAIHIAALALQDTSWQDVQRTMLRVSAARLDTRLEAGGLNLVGGTDLFRLARSSRAQDLFAHLLAHTIYVRRFDEHPDWLRFGLPGSEEDWAKLERALSSFEA